MSTPIDANLDSRTNPAGGHAAPAIVVRYSWKLLRAGPLLLDGGGMFGVVPRAIWRKVMADDSAGRISLAHNCLLLEREPGAHHPHDHDPSIGAPRRILIECGSGDKLDEKSRAIYGLTNRTIDTALDEAGVACEQIDAVILSHLHFDHCGGATRRPRAGEKADWTPPPNQREHTPIAGVKFTFPNAPIFVQRREWEDAIANRSHMRRTYLPENLLPLAERLRLLDAPAPFAADAILERQSHPPVRLADRTIEALPGIECFRIPGHTPGQQAIRFVDTRGQTIVFAADLIPTIHHIGAPYNMAYDLEPYVSSATRHWFLDEAARGKWMLVLDHEPNHPCVAVEPDGKGWFTLRPTETA